MKYVHICTYISITQREDTLQLSGFCMVNQTKSLPELDSDPDSWKKITNYKTVTTVKVSFYLSVVFNHTVWIPKSKPNEMRPNDYKSSAGATLKIDQCHGPWPWWNHNLIYLPR